jgi:ATP-dependent DNA helicase Rep/DNA helicase-2/ATP-dependent DNA helicase PcrA
LDQKDDDVRKNEVQLLTLHSSKGLEFDTVFLIGMEEEFLPHKRSIQESGNVDEERRLAYVGVTRAKERLIMTFAKKRKIHGREVPRHPSRFILGEPEKLILRQDRTTLEHLNDTEKEEYRTQKFDEMFKFLDE